MIEGTEPAFPNNVVSLVAEKFAMIDSDVEVFMRPLRKTDPNYAVGVFGTLWNPDEESLEMGHPYPGEPTLQRYLLGVQAFVKDGDEERGLMAHSVLSRAIRVVLYRDPALHVGLQTLYVADSNSTERMKRWWLGSQRYMNNDIEGQFVYISTLEYWIETEMA